MKRSFMITVLFAGIILSAGKVHAFKVDGDLSDWGVTPGVWGAAPGTAGASDWVPLDGTKYTQQVNNPAVDYQGPGYGGHLFNAEAMYAAYDSTNLYYAIVTGQPPTGALANYPGDIALGFGGAGTYQYGINTGVNSLTQGGLYSVTQWNLDPNWNSGTPTTMKTVGQLLASSPFVYNGTYYGASGQGSHYVMEGAIPLSAFGNNWGSGKTLSMSWTETCANNIIKLNVTPTPEPATMALFAMGLAGFAGLGLLRRRLLRA